MLGKTLYLFIIFLLVLTNSHAAIVANLFDFETPIADQSDANRNQGIRNAMKGVLIKLTGDRGIAGRPDVATEIVQQANRYIQQYEYRSKQVKTPDSIIPKNQLFLWVRFNENALKKTLLQNNVPLWGQERPVTLIWVVAEEDATRSYVNQEKYPEFIEQLNFLATQRGIKLIYPLYDLEDTFQVKPSDVMGGFNEAVLSASKRYLPDAVIIGAIKKQDENSWSGKWTSHIREQTVSWEVQSGTFMQILNAGIDEIADKLAQNYAQPSSQGYASSFDIIVGDIGNYERYAKVMNYLSKLSTVTDVLVKKANPDQITFTITARGGELSLSQTIELGNVLEPSGIENTYRLLP